MTNAREKQPTLRDQRLIDKRLEEVLKLAHVTTFTPLNPHTYWDNAEAAVMLWVRANNLVIDSPAAPPADAPTPQTRHTIPASSDDETWARIALQQLQGFARMGLQEETSIQYLIQLRQGEHRAGKGK